MKSLFSVTLVQPDLALGEALVAFCVALAVSTAILRLVCYLLREDVPGWAAALGIKLVSLVVGVMFSAFLFVFAGMASHHQKARLDGLVALNCFSLLANMLLNAGVYRVTMPWMSFSKSLLVVLLEMITGLVAATVLAVVIFFVATAGGWYSVAELQEMLQTP